MVKEDFIEYAKKDAARYTDTVLAALTSDVYRLIVDICEDDGARLRLADACMDEYFKKFVFDFEIDS